MPAFETMDLYDDAVLWAATGGVDKHGEPKVSAPVDIKCRWVGKRTDVVGPDGTPVAVDAEIVVAVDVKSDSRVWKGTLDEWLGSGSSGDETQVLYVKAVFDTGSLNNRFRRRTLMASRSMQSPQTG